MTRPLYLLQSPHSARHLFKAIRRGLPGTRATVAGPWRRRDFPETQEVVDVVGEEMETRFQRQHGRWPSSRRRRFTRTMLALQYNGWRAMFQKTPDAVAGCWNGMGGRRLLFLEAARRSGCGTLFFELSPLPGFVACDPKGINAANSLSRDPEFYTAWADASPGDDRWNDAWRGLGERLIPRKGRRRTAADSGDDQVMPPPSGRYLICPLQVPTDTQVMVYGGWIKTMEELITALHVASRQLPSGWHLRVKEHPSSKIQFGDDLRTLQDERFVISNDEGVFDQVAGSEGVVTLNSSVGLQAFFFEKPVVVLGEAFFGFSPLVTPASSSESLNAIAREPESIDFDPRVRNAFMNYLRSEYFLKADLSRPFSLDEKNIRKITQWL